MSSIDNSGSRNIKWPPPSPTSAEESQHYGQPHGQNQNLPKLKLTAEEVAVLQACSRESFWYRCVPLAFGAVLATQTLSYKGILRPNPRYGNMFKNMGAAAIAYLVGKLSYQGECRKKIMMLENSPLAEAMRKGRRGRDLFQEMTMIPPTFTGDGYSGEAESQENKSLAGSHLDIDTEYKKYKELDDGQRPTVDGASSLPRQDNMNQRYTTYADLRAQNRMDYERKMSNTGAQGGASRPPPSPDGQLPPPPPSSDMYSGIDSSSGPRRNKYGDVLD